LQTICKQDWHNVNRTGKKKAVSRK